MKKLLLFLVATLTSMNLVKAQCDLSFEFVNTGTNMTAFFTPPAASAIHAELGDGTIGSFYTDADGSLICAASAAFNGAQIQLAVMADDSTSPDKDGFSSGESINWFYQTADGSIFSISPSNDNFTINGISFIQSASISAIDCGGDDDSSNGDQCPALDFSFVNTGSNMTLFITPPGASALATLGNGTIGVYYIDNDGQQLCGGASAFTGTQVQITAMADDSTSPEKDGFSAGEAIVWKFEDNNGNQYNLTPSPQDGFALNGISFISGISYDAISCAVDLEGCTDSDFIEYNPNASIDDGSCATIAVYGCTDADYLEYNANANVDNGSCVNLIIEGCTNNNYVEYNSDANIDNGSCTTLIVNGCTDVNAENYNPDANTSDGSCEYDLIGAGCQVSFETYNSGTNHTVMIPGSVSTPLSSGDQIGVFYIGDDGSAVCAGASIWTGGNLQIVAFGDDTTTPELDGLEVGSPFLFIAQSGDDVYVVNASFQSPAMANYAVNGLSFVTGFDFELACTVQYLGCTDLNACNYDSTANTNDGSCVYPDNIYDCDGGCVNDSDGDLVCDEFEVVGCQDESASNYDASATDSGDCDYLGCTDLAYLEYDSSATLDDGSCTTLIVNGCTDVNAENYNPDANTSDGSCEYDLIGAGCQVSFETYNSGTNHTVMIPGSVSTPLSSGDQIGVFYIGDDGSAVCAGASIWTGGNLQIVAFGDDTTTPELDGLEVGSPFLFIAQSGDDVYVVNASFQSPAMANYAVNGLSFVTGFDFELACTVQYLGCTDLNACNYDSTANTNDGSCVYPDNIYDCDGGCVNDSDGDLVCDEFEVVGCQDESASNYDASATDSGDCVSWEDAYESCIESGGDDGIGQEDVDAAFENGVASVDITSDNQAVADEAYGWGYGDGFSAGAASVVPEDGVSQSDLDAAVAEVQANAASQIALLEAQIENILENCGDDGVTQADVDAAYADGVASVICDPNAGYDTGYSDGAASITPEDGIGQADVDAAYADGVASVDITSDNSAIADESYLYGYNDGVASAQTDIDALQTLLDEALSNSGGGSCEPIYIDLLEGWNIMGYTLPYPQDVAATLASIVSNVQIVKNNSAAVYWPEYSFNGIGDFIPGQGYQIRMNNALNSYTFPDVGGQRIELSPTVPEWVHELPVLNHPNDIRSLVRVVNLLGQQVDPSTQLKGEILLYLYNDGTTEKRIVN